MILKSFFVVLAASFVGAVAALDLAASSWIWTNEVLTPAGTAPVGSRAFRKTWSPPLGKTPVMANILVDVDNGLTLYVNGGEIGTGGDFRFAERFCVALRPCFNVFAVTGVNAGGPAALIAAIEIVYSDGTTSTLVSDSTWVYSRTVPSGYQLLSFDDSSWPPAVAQGKIPMAPWGQPTVPSTPSTLTLTKSNWVWTNEVAGPGGAAPIGSRAFRRTYVPPTGTTPTSAEIIIAADNAYSLWVNGLLVGNGTSFTKADTYKVDLVPGKNLVVAVQATNIPPGGPAGLIAAVEVTSADCKCTSGAFFITDGSWKCSTSVPDGFQDPEYDDAAWPAVTVEGPYGMAPWGNTVFTA